MGPIKKFHNHPLHCFKRRGHLFWEGKVYILRTWSLYVWSLYYIIRIASQPDLEILTTCEQAEILKTGGVWGPIKKFHNHPLHCFKRRGHLFWEGKVYILRTWSLYVWSLYYIIRIASQPDLEILTTCGQAEILKTGGDFEPH